MRDSWNAPPQDVSPKRVKEKGTLGRALLRSPSLLALWSCLHAPFISTAETGHVRLLVNDNTADLFASLCGTKERQYALSIL